MRFYKDEDVLDKIRDMRNEFAHSRRRTYLSSYEKGICYELLDEVLNEIKDIKVYEYEEKDDE